ncbi:AN1-type zinc finger protein 1 isoform X2 [Crotalus tigris]|uniref:AN1-type zinc finger protein 1 isoform X2 n=1 Tax=Crotalus tigris TaxID=88082 RepID=UPI00192FB368|nr:AN1-type zinc finger protein 1 isoform X2 [Crotalus tigris]
MAELEIGQHCGVEECKQLDFLPFVCDGCSGVFCIQHRSRSAHSCSEANLKNKNMKLDYHKSFSCTYKGCDGRELVPVLCAYCEKQFCLRHRHQSDHECEKLEIPQACMTATQQLIKDIVDSKKEATVIKKCRGAKNPETAAKVALMKLKMHACGEKSIPQTDRIYFQVFLPKGSKNKSIPMYFCSKWSIGKVIDSAAHLASLKNDNNKTTAKAGMHVRIRNVNTPELCSATLSPRPNTRRKKGSFSRVSRVEFRRAPKNIRTLGNQ